MNKITGSLGFRLITASFLVVAVFIFIASLTVYRFSQDAIKNSLVRTVQEMAKDLDSRLLKEEPLPGISDALLTKKIDQTGSVWLMDKDGFLLYHPNPVFRDEYVNRHKSLGNVVVSLQYAYPRVATGVAKQKLVDIIQNYENGFGTFQQFGETRVLAFQVIKEKGWLIGLDQPESTANSELSRIKIYIRWTGFVSAVLIMLFTWLAIRIIVKPYYREMEELNLRLQTANRQMSEANVKLDASNRKLTALYKISITMQETMSLQDILDLIVAGAQEVLNVDRVNIMLPSKDGNMLQCRAAIGQGERPLSEIALPLSSRGGAIAAAFKRGQVIRIGLGEHLPQHLRLTPPYDRDPFLRSSAFVVVPMMVKNRSVGAIAIDNKVSKEPITDDMVNLIQIFANQAAVAVDNARLYEELRRNIEELDAKVDQLAIVNQISNTMQTMIRKKEMLGFILRGIRESMGFDALMICLIDREEDVLRGEIGVNLAEEKVHALSVSMGDEENPMVAVLNRGRPANWYSARTADLLKAVTANLSETDLRESQGATVEGAKLAMALIPVRVLDKVAGLIAAGRSSKSPAIAKREIELLMLFANTAGLAVERADLYQKLQTDMEKHDTLDTGTRLYTPSYGQQRLIEEMIKARDAGRDLTVVMLGVDNFKEYNERHGREIGDRALSEIGSLVKAALGASEVAFRYGGRLICCLLPGQSSSAVKPKAEKLRQMIGQHQFIAGEKDDGKVRLTASIGIFTFQRQESIKTPSDLFKASMACLHRAEAAGGDNVLAE